jgi:hypothetical protein
MWRWVGLVRTDVSEKLVDTIARVERIRKRVTAEVSGQ